MSISKTPIDIVQEGEKNPRGIPKALFIVRTLRSILNFSQSRAFAPLLPLHLSSRHRSCTLLLICRSILQNDVEEYLGGPDAAVERVLSAFQDALACVYHR
jgi:hypothetical protein